jgi:serine/threonine protein kinase
MIGVYANLGQYDKALAEAREALRLNPVSGVNYANLVQAFSVLNRLEEAWCARTAFGIGQPSTCTYRGTLPYMAPEQLRGEPAEVRTDIWAAGAVLYEMATAHGIEQLHEHHAELVG